MLISIYIYNQYHLFIKITSSLSSERYLCLCCPNDFKSAKCQMPNVYLYVVLPPPKSFESSRFSLFPKERSLSQSRKESLSLPTVQNATIGSTASRWMAIACPLQYLFSILLWEEYILFANFNCIPRRGHLDHLFGAI